MKMKLSCLKSLMLFTLLVLCVGNVWCLPIGFSDITEKITEKNGYLIGEGYKIKLLPEPKQLITGVSRVDLGKGIFPGSELKLGGVDWVMGGRFTFENPTSHITVEIRLAVYPTVRKAQESVLLVLNSVAAVRIPGVKSGEEIGDSCWYSEWNNNSHIWFLRTNVFAEVVVPGKGYSASIDAARAIDQVLVSGTAGVKLGTHSPSLIKSIDIPAKMHVGEVTTIRIHPNNINGKQLKYFLGGGDGFQDKIIDGEFVYKGRMIGKEKLVFFLHDEDCRVSWEVKEIEIVP